MERNGELLMTFPIVAGKLLIAGGLVSCQCCTPAAADPPDPMLDVLLATATSAGGGLGCLMGPVVKTFEETPPYELAPGTYQLRVDFTTGDNLYHVGSYYEVQLGFTPATASIAWATSSLGTVADPWVETNGGRSLRFNVEDSDGACGGSNANVQSGTAIATITVTATTQMDFDFSGIAELQDTGYENISFYLRTL